MSGYIPAYIKRMMDHLYLSDHRAQIDTDKFKLVIDLNYPQNGVKLGEIKDESRNGTRTLRVGVADSEDQDMSSALEVILPVINQFVKSSQPVLIYSHDGWSRSTMVLSSYLIQKYGFKMRDISHVYQTSGLLHRLNPFFVEQLDLQVKKNEIKE
jgi:protein-tyrosine phosphatase